jgi:hypothetical protein
MKADFSQSLYFYKFLRGLSSRNISILFWWIFRWDFTWTLLLKMLSESKLIHESQEIKFCYSTTVSSMVVMVILIVFNYLTIILRTKLVLIGFWFLMADFVQSFFLSQRSSYENSTFSFREQPSAFYENKNMVLLRVPQSIVFSVEVSLYCRALFSFKSIVLSSVSIELYVSVLCFETRSTSPKHFSPNKC